MYIFKLEEVVYVCAPSGEINCILYVSHLNEFLIIQADPLDQVAAKDQFIAPYQSYFCISHKLNFVNKT